MRLFFDGSKYFWLTSLQFVSEMLKKAIPIDTEYRRLV